MSPQRAKDLIRLHNWSNGGCLNVGNPKPQIEPMTPAEDRIVKLLWQAGPGYGTQHGILCDIANERIPQELIPVGV